MNENLAHFGLHGFLTHAIHNVIHMLYIWYTHYTYCIHMVHTWYIYVIKCYKHVICMLYICYVNMWYICSIHICWNHMCTYFNYGTLANHDGEISVWVTFPCIGLFSVFSRAGSASCRPALSIVNWPVEKSATTTCLVSVALLVTEV